MAAECIGIPFPVPSTVCECGEPMKQVEPGTYRVALAGSKWKGHAMPPECWLHTPDLNLGCSVGWGRARPPMPKDAYLNDYDTLVHLYGGYA